MKYSLYTFIFATKIYLKCLKSCHNSTSSSAIWLSLCVGDGDVPGCTGVQHFALGSGRPWRVPCVHRRTNQWSPRCSICQIHSSSLHDSLDDSLDDSLYSFFSEVCQGRLHSVCHILHFVIFAHNVWEIHNRSYWAELGSPFVCHLLMRRLKSSLGKFQLTLKNLQS